MHTRGNCEKKVVPAGTNPPPSFLFFVMSGSLAPLFIICGQTIKLKPISCLLNKMSMEWMLSHRQHYHYYLHGVHVVSGTLLRTFEALVLGLARRPNLFEIRNDVVTPERIKTSMNINWNNCLINRLAKQANSNHWDCCMHWDHSLHIEIVVYTLRS